MRFTSYRSDSGYLADRTPRHGRRMVATPCGRCGRHAQDAEQQMGFMLFARRTRALAGNPGNPGTAGRNRPLWRSAGAHTTPGQPPEAPSRLPHCAPCALRRWPTNCCRSCPAAAAASRTRRATCRASRPVEIVVSSAVLDEADVGLSLHDPEHPQIQSTVLPRASCNYCTPWLAETPSRSTLRYRTWPGSR